MDAPSYGSDEFAGDTHTTKTATPLAASADRSGAVPAQLPVTDPKHMSPTKKIPLILPPFQLPNKKKGS